MNASEKQRFRGYFPSLDVNWAVVTGEISSVYTCLSWTLGHTDRWLWPGSSMSDFDKLYHGFGYVRAANGPIAAWGHSTAKTNYSQPRSRLDHPFEHLTASNSIVADRATHQSPWGLRRATRRSEHAGRVTERRGQEEQQQHGDDGASLMGNYPSGADPHTRAVGKEFAAVIALGQGILPCAVEKLADSENFLALQLHDAIQPDERLLVDYGLEDERIVEGTNA
jgi:hypothetical protein